MGVRGCPYAGAAPGCSSLEFHLGQLPFVATWLAELSATSGCLGTSRSLGLSLLPPPYLPGQLRLHAHTQQLKARR